MLPLAISLTETLFIMCSPGRNTVLILFAEVINFSISPGPLNRGAHLHFLLRFLRMKLPNSLGKQAPATEWGSLPLSFQPWSPALTWATVPVLSLEGHVRNSPSLLWACCTPGAPQGMASPTQGTADTGLLSGCCAWVSFSRHPCSWYLRV